METDDLKMDAMFDYLDQFGSQSVTATVEVVLRNGLIMTVKAGGPGTGSRPTFAPFEAYEVLTDHEPPRFWSKFSDDGADWSVYHQVPRLLVAHHITRHGGVAELVVTADHSDTRAPRPARQVTVTMSLTVDEDYARAVREAVEKVASAHLISSLLTFS